VDDGSKDRSVAMLREQFDRRPDVTRVVVLARNVGQHMAILAAFQHTRGTYVITLDADLQNPPEEISKIVAAMDAGSDYVGTIRKRRQDVYWRKAASRLMNQIRERTTHISITDQGCMLRGYHRQVIDAINRCTEVSTYVPALGYTFARHPVEIEVAHAERTAGESKYSLYRLIRLNFDLMTGFSVAPLQFFSMAGFVIALLSLIFVGILAIRRIVFGPEAEGLFTLFGIAFFLNGVALIGLGVVGEYIGRIYEQVRQRPRYTVAAVLEEDPAKAVQAPARIERVRETAE
jgi:undecaprenyl-phosphate 4-deoxy-4-formamido-L-arabinose transferase